MPALQKATAIWILQEAVSLLAHWTDQAISFTPDKISGEGRTLVNQAKKLANWPANSDIKSLQLVFDKIELTQSSIQHSTARQEKVHYLPPIALDQNKPSLVYPTTEQPDLTPLKKQVAQALSTFFTQEEDWQNFGLLLTTLEKFATHISIGGGDISLYDLARTTSAIAAALHNNPHAENLCLIAGDLSGIQTFIYTIASAGALKSLRARSFYLQLVTEEIVHRLLHALSLPSTSIIYAGGGNLYILAPAGEATLQAVTHMQERINRWLLKDFQSKVFLALTAHDCPTQAVQDKAFATQWEAAIQKLAKQKNQKFGSQLKTVFSEKLAYENCKVCHRDDVRELFPLNPKEPNSVEACHTCRDLFALGGKLPKANKAIVRSEQAELPHSAFALPFHFPNAEGKIETIYYHCFTNVEHIPTNQPAWLINRWDLSHHKRVEMRSLFMGDYYATSKSKETNNEAFIRAEELAQAATGIKRVGYLRMDVDRLGRIFAKGLGDEHTLPRLATLSRQMSYFFQTGLNYLAEDRNNNLPLEAKTLSNCPRKELLFIYAGGDDLFISGAWDQIVEFSFDIYQSFRAYTGHHPGITLSGGVSLGTPKYPLYQAADDSGRAESAAKSNGRDSFSLFGEVFKWSAWLGEAEPKSLNEQDLEYLVDSSDKYPPVEQPPIMGVFPLAKQINQQLSGQLSHNFVRNLLATAQLQEQAIKDAKEKKRSQVDRQDLRYFLHLPKIAYTLSRLPQNIRGEPEFADVRTSLKSPYNAPYFRAIATWIDLLNRTQPSQSTKDTEQES